MTDRSPTSSASAAELPFPTASWTRRMVALLVDWFACTLVVAAFVGVRAVPFAWLFTGVESQQSDNLWVLGIFVAETTVLTSLAGGSFGKLLTRLRTVRVPVGGGLDPRPLDPVRGLARQVLLVLVIPPLVFKPDGRGLHDLAAATATVTLQTYRSAYLGK